MTIIPPTQPPKPDQADLCQVCGEPIEFCAQTGWWLHTTLDSGPFHAGVPGGQAGSR